MQSLIMIHVSKFTSRLHSVWNIYLSTEYSIYLVDQRDVKARPNAVQQPWDIFHTYEIKRKNPEYQHFTTFYQHPWDIFHIYEIWINSWIPAFHPNVIHADILRTGSVNPRPKIMFSDKTTKKTKRKKWEKRQLWKKNEALSCWRVKMSARQGLVQVHSCTI